MEIRNPQTPMTLNRDLQHILQAVRNNRGFNPQTYLDAKAILLNEYLAKAGLTSVVVAVSGGIDSAVVLGIAKHAQGMTYSPIQRIVAVTMPDRLNDGVTGQDEAADLARQVCMKMGVAPTTIEMGGIVQSIMAQVELAVGLPGIDKAQWCHGQATSYARTPTYYYITSVLAAQGTPGVVLGTTNLSEGGYLGYFGKASDGMVDLQMISDIYKSEVYKVGALLGIPEAVMTRAPTGDMYDATTDEVVFGAPYDYVEIFQEMLRTEIDYDVALVEDDETLGLMAHWDDNLKRMHSYNAHKYLGRSPAVHLDIMPCAIKGGWDNSPAIPPQVKTRGLKNLRRIRGEFEHCAGMANMDPEYNAMATAKPLHPSIPTENAFKLDLLLPEEADRILRNLPDERLWEAVGVDGRNYTHPEYKEGAPIGSYRASTFNKDFAEDLWARIKGALPSIRITDQMTPTDTDNSRIWKPVGVAELMRVIKYLPGGMLVPHYDLTHVLDANRRTLMSLVIQLTPGKGATNFLHEPQISIPHIFRDNSDWTRTARPEDIIVSIEPKVGQALVFDHGLLHEGSPVLEGEKVVIRTDIIFERAEWFD
jgi:NAD+ synthetase